VSLISPEPSAARPTSRLAKVLKRGCALLVSLPRNDADLARAAEAGGADALKVHINVRHEASGTTFGSLEEERKNLEAILKAVQAPVGIVTGGERQPSRGEAEQLVSMGFDFFDAFAHHMPAWMIRMEKVTRVAAVDSNYSFEQIYGLASAGAHAIEAAVVPADDYGKPLTAYDLARYCAIRRGISLPIIVPTQKKIEPEEAADLTQRLCIEAVMIGVIVAGDNPQSIEKATASFAKCLRSKSPAS
jgi:hypothetical protein